ncbi:CRISPR system precrRNA processing endoribonuclease RAMP protein Cas6 [Aggregatilinea lenta]|uniref:CRISPR system precrRNA processing endoribonuclease RAMP protein Cas6 n=1 Tax=Aggregatilinea lenta TaxID=913108 RepID=UPI000E5BD27C|nr:CRISPR system precrRNA processing endoribonuclease RAMP protein Cas6 [Aggregatilinea lenta]
MTDLGALVLTLRATRALEIRQHMGRAVQQLCLDLVRDVDPALSAEIHTTHQVQPYTASGLLLPNSTHRLAGTVAPGDQAWVRLVGLRADVVAALDEAVRRSPSARELDRVPWEIERATWTDHPWAGQTTYEALIRHHHSAAPPTAVWFEVASPTAFSSADLNIPLPDPVRIFDSLRQQWEALNPLPPAFALPERLMEFVRRFVPLTEYSAHTEALMFKSPEIGFCAERVKFAIKQRVSVPKRWRVDRPDEAAALDALNAHRDDLARAIALLADFAFYSGVGIKTTTGMGMVRRV